MRPKQTVRVAKATFLGVSLMAAFLVARPAMAQSLDDYKEAAGKDGCESIPYSNYRDVCKRNQEKVDEVCKTDKWSCDGLQTKALRENIKSLGEKIDRLKEEKDKVNEQKSSADNDDDKRKLDDRINEIQKEIDQKMKDLEFLKKSLETDLSDIEIRLDKGRQCLDARNDVQGAFKSATEDAQHVSDPDIKPWAERLIDKWAAGRERHEQAQRNVKEGIENCNKCKAGDL